MQRIKRLISTLIPRSLYRALLVPYHIGWQLFAAIRYGFPARKLTVIGITGTKGKSSVTEMVAAVLEEAGHKIAISSTIHFKVGDKIRPNLYKMTLPGHGFIQKLMHEAVDAGCTHLVVELTSEAALQYRHLFLSLNALVFTNLQKEHVESHGSMENYFQAKFRLAKALAHSEKRPRAIIANNEDEYGKRFLSIPVEEQIPFSTNSVTDFNTSSDGVSFIYKEMPFLVPQPGTFSMLNALASIKLGEFLSIPIATSQAALKKLSRIPGRAERIDAGQNFLAVVDYAHTPDSLKALYTAYPGRKICVLGNTGGGRDTWKRPEMGSIADDMCAEVILTNEDPYDENPEQILTQMASGMKREPRVIMDRREAIHTALSLAQPGDVVLVTGKGTDPYIMQANGVKLPWSDAQVVREELEKLQK
jgi:UDP-N-acetylmuramoyl-L-alanyl-D-glutamate--2,6-diaminopimelate ligase